MVSIIILMIGLLGMLQVINLAIATNLQNDFRNQAVLIAEEQMARVKNLPFDNLSTTGERSINTGLGMRGAFKNYSVTLGISNVANSKKIDIGIRWQYKRNRYEHVISTLIAKPATQQ
jgi:type IV pilus assembly protein PilV